VDPERSHCACRLRANAAFSTVGDGAATRAGTVVIFAWIVFVSVRLLQKGETEALAMS
jgi:hypothetical protein